MTGFSSKAALVLAFLGLAACGQAPAPAPASPPSTASASAHDRLSRIVDRYWDEHIPPGIPQSPQFMADSLALERRFLGELRAVPRAALDADSTLTYDIFERRRESDIDA